MIETLYDVPIGKTVVVEYLNCSGNIRRRLLDLGIIKGTKIKPIFKSPSGDPTAFEVRGTVLAIRKENCKDINVRLWIVYIK